MSGMFKGEHGECMLYHQEVNAVAGCQVYTAAAAMCDPCLLSVVQEVWSKAFVNTDVLFAANNERFHRPGKAWVHVHQC